MVRNDHICDAVRNSTGILAALDPQFRRAAACGRVDFDAHPAGAVQILEQEAAATSEVNDGVRRFDQVLEFVRIDSPGEQPPSTLPGKILLPLLAQVVVGCTV